MSDANKKWWIAKISVLNFQGKSKIKHVYKLLIFDQMMIEWMGMRIIQANMLIQKIHQFRKCKT